MKPRKKPMRYWSCIARRLRAELDYMQICVFYDDESEPGVRVLQLWYEDGCTAEYRAYARSLAIIYIGCAPDGELDDEQASEWLQYH